MEIWTLFTEIYQHLSKKIWSDLQRTFFRMKRNFEKKKKNIAREYSMERKEGESHLPHTTFASHTFANQVFT